ncbi:hypothetical protein BOTBODRAFT_40754 [Botryobasidium botryosum FD-172 SS1]|uniref:Mediator of RNA polymerase II transcription subunit 6 n=1 Tax=Botryobasidium botryosum (strain FD-172 SS1) TaxID=930990 RepID=A0A067MYF0_BOTB1|nr:hypothetical protein BOTBODRAFT_40754 [Botryobasidium botryosum FD-172 SS1]
MATPADDLSEQSFYWPEFIQACAPLNTQSAFDYFKTSPWYNSEPSSTNQILRMQTQHTGIELSITDEAEELRKFTGIEFAIVHAVPPSLFVIHKRERLSPEEVRPMEAYYIINNRIQQSPDLYSLLANRLNAALYNLRSSLSTVRAHRPDYTPRRGHQWPVLPDPTTITAASETKAAEDVEGGVAVASTTDTIDAHGSTGAASKSAKASEQASSRPQIVIPLLHAMHTTAAHIKTISPVPDPGQPSNKRVRAAMDVAPVAAAGDARTDTPMNMATATQTPGISSGGPTPGPSDEVQRAPAVGGKKKKKRSTMQPAAQ